MCLFIHTEYTQSVPYPYQRLEEPKMNYEPQRTPEQQAELEEQLVAALNRNQKEMDQRHPSGYRLTDTGSVVFDENGNRIATQVCFLRCLCRALGRKPLLVIRILGLENNTQPLSPAQQQRVCDYLRVNVCEYDAGNENRRKTIRCNSPSDKVVHIWLQIGHYYLLESEMDSRVDAQVQADMAEAQRLSEAEAEADAEDLSDVAEAHRLSELDAEFQADVVEAQRLSELDAQVQADVAEAQQLDAEFQAAQVEDVENWDEFQASQVEADLGQQQQDDYECAVRLQANIIEAQCQSEVRAAQVEADRRAAVGQQQQEDHAYAVQLQANIIDAQRRAEAEAEVAAQILADNETARVQQLHEDYKFARMLSPRAC